MRPHWMIALVAVASLPLAAAADTVTLQGRLLNGGGGVAPDGAYAVVFSLWDAEEDGEQLWEEPHTGDPAVEVAGGVFAARLGGTVPLSPALLIGGPRWVQVQVVPDPPLPRQPLGTVPWAMVARAIDCTGCIPLTAMAVAPATASEVAALSEKLGVVDASVQALEANLPALAVDAVEGAAGLTLSGSVHFGGFPAQAFRLELAVADPVACSPEAVGYVYFNTAAAQVLVCDGDAFVPLVNKVPIGTEANPAQSCLHILDAGDSTGDGPYWLDPDQSGPLAAAKYYCDMTEDGGGWTRVEGAHWPGLFNAGNWEDFAGDDPVADMYSALKARFAFQNNGCWTYRVIVGNSASWKANADHRTVWKQCHDPFTQATDGSDYTFLSGEEPVTCGGFNGLHNKYTGFSFADDVDTTDSGGCWYMQIVPHTQHGGTQGYLDGYGGQYYGRQWQSLWLK